MARSVFWRAGIPPMWTVPSFFMLSTQSVGQPEREFCHVAWTVVAALFLTTHPPLRSSPSTPAVHRRHLLQGRHEVDVALEPSVRRGPQRRAKHYAARQPHVHGMSYRVCISARNLTVCGSVPNRIRSAAVHLYRHLVTGGVPGEVPTSLLLAPGEATYSDLTLGYARRPNAWCPPGECPLWIKRWRRRAVLWTWSARCSPGSRIRD